MNCPSCGKDSDFYNVDLYGFTHCPKCGAIDMTNDEFKKCWDKMISHKKFIQEVEYYGSHV